MANFLHRVTLQGHYTIVNYCSMLFALSTNHKKVCANKLCKNEINSLAHNDLEAVYLKTTPSVIRYLRDDPYDVMTIIGDGVRKE